ncbi:MAG: 2-dehydropantoate 2-reductase [Bacteroidales bacterium]|nr:2-dehydropantoate 2-reductase [Bacteroidales bacterium]
MKYAVIGTGAIGGYYGGRLAHSGQEVHFLAHSDYEEMRSQGLQVDSCLGSFIIENPRAYRSTSEMPVVDVVFVALKTVNNHLLPEMLKPIVGPDTIVVLIQNGIGVEEDLQAQMPGLQIATGLGFICSTKIGPAHISHQDYGALTLANYSVKDDNRVGQVATDLEQAGVATDILPYDFARWRKAIWNLPFNGLTVALNTDTLSLVNSEEGYALLKNIMMEVIALANAAGVESLNVEHALSNLEATRSMLPYAPSMKVDWDHHRPMEIYYLYTKALQKADALGVKAPYLEMLEKQLRYLERHRR